MDASPQAGVEIYNCASLRMVILGGERVHRWRKLPLQALPHGFLGADGKVLAVLWMLFLESGLEAWCS
jgi:hypothetical protein